MRPEDEVGYAGLSGVRLQLAGAYNTRGKYFHAQATGLGVSSAALAAVLHVESSGRGFGTDGRHTVRFENHIFHGRWGPCIRRSSTRTLRSRQEGAVGRSLLASDGDGPVGGMAHARAGWRVGGAGVRHGAGRVGSGSVGELGRRSGDGVQPHGAGVGTAPEMAAKYPDGIRPHFNGMETVIKGNPACMKGLKANDYTLFATRYNGTGQAAA